MYTLACARRALIPGFAHPSLRVDNHEIHSAAYGRNQAKRPPLEMAQSVTASVSQSLSGSESTSALLRCRHQHGGVRSCTAFDSDCDCDCDPYADTDRYSVVLKNPFWQGSSGEQYKPIAGISRLSFRDTLTEENRYRYWRSHAPCDRQLCLDLDVFPRWKTAILRQEQVWMCLIGRPPSAQAVSGAESDRRDRDRAKLRLRSRQRT